jgi:hypothetical protein
LSALDVLARSSSGRENIINENEVLLILYCNYI